MQRLKQNKGNSDENSPYMAAVMSAQLVDQCTLKLPDQGSSSDFYFPLNLKRKLNFSDLTVIRVASDPKLPIQLLYWAGHVSKKQFVEGNILVTKKLKSLSNS